MSDTSSSPAVWKGWEAVVAPPPEVIAERQSTRSTVRPLRPRLLPRLHRVEGAAVSSPPIGEVLRNAAEHFAVNPITSGLRSITSPTFGKKTSSSGNAGDVQICGFSSLVDSFSRLVAAAIAERTSHQAAPRTTTTSPLPVDATSSVPPAVPAAAVNASSFSPHDIILLEGCHPVLAHIAHARFGLVVKYCPLLPWKSLFDAVAGQLPSATTSLSLSHENTCTLSFDHTALRSMTAPPHKKPLLVFLGGHVMLDAGIPWEMFRGCPKSTPPPGCSDQHGNTTIASSSAELQQQCLAEVTLRHHVRVVLEHHCHHHHGAGSVSGDESVFDIVRRIGAVSLISTSFGNTSGNQSCLLISPPPPLMVVDGQHQSATRIPHELILTASHSRAHFIKDVVGLLRQLFSWMCARDPLSVGLLYVMTSAALTILRPNGPRVSTIGFFKAIRDIVAPGSSSSAGSLLAPLETKLLHRSIATTNSTPTGIVNTTASGLTSSPLSHSQRVVWHMVARFPPYMEVVSASDPSAPQLATFLSHGVVVSVRNPAMVMRALLHAGHEVIPVAPTPASSSAEEAATGATIASTFLRIAVSSNMSSASWRRLLILLWSLPAADVASPNFRPWSQESFTHWVQRSTACATPSLRPVVAAIGNAKEVTAAKKQQRSKRDPRKGTLPHLYHHPHVAAFVTLPPLASSDHDASPQHGFTKAFESNAVRCLEGTSPLAVLILGPSALALAKL